MNISLHRNKGHCSKINQSVVQRKYDAGADIAHSDLIFYYATILTKHYTEDLAVDLSAFEDVSRIFAMKVFISPSAGDNQCYHDICNDNPW